MTIEHIAAASREGRIGIVHLGLGAFHRAHQAVYLERYRQISGDTDWGIVSANLRSNLGLVDALAAADYRYHVAEQADRETATLREIGAIEATFFTGRDADGAWGRDLDALLARMGDSSVRIVTLTVTEKGYFLNPSTGELRVDDPMIATDIKHPETPRTAPGIVCAALARRRAAGVPAFTVVSCDNLPANGQRTRAAVIGLAERSNPELAAWIADNAAFPSSMVDRIVPATTGADRERLAAFGVDDPNAVVCEAFSQWVIEDDFPAGRPAWENVGVQMVADVTPFETMKLRMLNGCHSLLAYLGSLAGIDTVAEAVARDDMIALLRRYMTHEAAPTLAMPAGVDLNAYGEQLLARFANDSLAHRLQQIAIDGSQKLPQRWLAGARQQLDNTDEIACVALGVAAWIRYTAGTDLEGKTFTVDDPMAERLAALHAEHVEDTGSLVAAFLAEDAIFAPALAESTVFVDAVITAYRRLCDERLTAVLGGG